MNRVTEMDAPYKINASDDTNLLGKTDEPASITQIKTNFLIMSDTHGMNFATEFTPPQNIDVVLHCGDLTEESMLSEFHTTIALLKKIPASLKLVIAGNHDFTLDDAVFAHKIEKLKQTRSIDQKQIDREYGKLGEARQLFDEAADSGIHFLDEGTHTFKLQNGASLSVYASPMSLAFGGDWGFQYSPKESHHFNITNSDEPNGVDVVITHGPPFRILDCTASGRREGSQDLLDAISRAKPLLHCFGHIHVSRGAKLVGWEKLVLSEDKNDPSSQLTFIDEAKTKALEMGKDGVSLGELQLERQAQTIFINAALKREEQRDYLERTPFFISIDLANLA